MSQVSYKKTEEVLRSTMTLDALSHALPGWFVELLPGGHIGARPPQGADWRDLERAFRIVRNPVRRRIYKNPI